MGEISRNDPRIRGVEERSGPRDPKTGHGNEKAAKPDRPVQPRIKPPSPPEKSGGRGAAPSPVSLPPAPPPAARTPPSRPAAERPKPAKPPKRPKPPKAPKPPKRPKAPKSRRKPARKSKSGATIGVMIVFAMLGLLSKVSRCSDRKKKPSHPVPTRFTTGHGGTSIRNGLSGMVRMGSRPPPAGVRVGLGDVNGAATRFAQTDHRGQFVFAGIQPGTHRVELQPAVEVRRYAGVSQTASRGSPSVRLALSQRTTVVLRRAFPADLPGEIEVRLASADGKVRKRGRWVAADATALLTGLAPDGRYAVMFRHAQSNSALIRHDVTGGEDFRVALGPAAALRGRLKLPRGVAAKQVKGTVSHRGIEIRVPLSEAGWFEVETLPVRTECTLRFLHATFNHRREVEQRVIIGDLPFVEVALSD